MEELKIFNNVVTKCKTKKLKSKNINVNNTLKDNEIDKIIENIEILNEQIDNEMKKTIRDVRLIVVR